MLKFNRTVKSVNSTQNFRSFLFFETFIWLRLNQHHNFLSFFLFIIFSWFFFICSFVSRMFCEWHADHRNSFKMHYGFFFVQNITSQNLIGFIIIIFFKRKLQKRHLSIQYSIKLFMIIVSNKGTKYGKKEKNRTLL